MLKMQCVLDEPTRECLTIVQASRLRSQDMFLTLSRPMRLYGNNGVEFPARQAMRWLRDEAAGPAFVAPGQVPAERLC